MELSGVAMWREWVERACLIGQRDIWVNERDDDVRYVWDILARDRTGSHRGVLGVGCGLGEEGGVVRLVEGGGCGVGLAEVGTWQDLQVGCLWLI